MKKWICLLLAAIMLLSSATGAFAASDDYYEKEKQLIKMGVLSEEHSPLGKISEYDLYKAIIQITVIGETGELTDNVIAELANSIGLTDKKTDEELEGGITYYNAIKAMVKLLGYERMMTDKKDASYLFMAQKYNLTDGIQISSNGALSWYNAVNLIYNYKDAIPFYENESLLEMVHGIYKIRGIVTANEKTAILGSRAPKGMITLEDITMHAGDSGAGDFLGKNTEAYVKYDRASEEYTVIYIKERNNKSVTLDDSEGITTDAKSYIKYEGLDGSEKSYKLAAALKVIYNGASYDDYTAADFAPESGSVTIIDNNSDGTYEVVIIESYQTVLVGSTSEKEKIITNRYSYTGALRKVDLKVEDEYDFKSLKKDGAEITVADVKYNDVLSVKVNKSGDVDIVEAVVSSSQVTGKITAQSERDNEITVAAENYRLGGAYLDASAAKDTIAEDIKFGVATTLYLDVFGEVAAIMYESDDKEYAWMLKMGKKDERMVETYLVRYMDMTEEWITAELCEKVIYNGNKIDDDMLYGALVSKGKITPQPVTIKLNSEGKIKELETAVKTTDKDYEYMTVGDTLYVSYTYSDKFRVNPNPIYLEADTKCIVVPETLTYDEEDYSVATKDMFEVDKFFTFTPYNLDEYNFTDLLVTPLTQEYEDRELAGSGIFIVLDVGERLDSDGSTMTAIEGIYGTYGEIWVGGEDDVFDDVEPGDLLKIRSRNGKVVDKQILASMKETDSFGISHPNDDNADGCIHYGTVVKCALSEQRLIMNVGYEKSIRVTGTPKVYEYCKRTGLISEISAADISEDDYIMVHSDRSNVKNIYKITE